MSQQIENQIVKMEFDNASFEKNAQQSMSTIDKLKSLLKFDKVDMTPLQQAFNDAENTATKAGFSIRDVWIKVASEIENQVAQKIVDAGKKIFNALTLEGVSDGFKEYELKMGSIQTIMNGTGEDLATVNRYLDELNKYSDQTIYSFSDMTQSIGKFTNAGVKLEDAVAAIKGVANEAAISGANANEASRAMYNFAQALSAGYVKLIDWKSIENANMATKGFKEALLEVGVACGTVEKNADGMYNILTENNQGKTMADAVSGTKNFNDSLQYQWMTTEVLTNTLKLYATDVRSLTDAQKEAYEAQLRKLGLDEEQIKRFEELGSKATDAASEIKTFSMLMDTLKEAIGSGWAMTWQILIGDFEQAKSLWTEVGTALGGMIDNMSDARNALLTEGLTTGWEKFISIQGKAIPQSEKFRDILVDLAKDQGKLSKEQADGIESTNDLIKSFHELGWVTGDLLVESVDDYYNILSKMSDEELLDFGISSMELAELEELNKGLHDGSINADEFAEKMKKLGGRENIIEGLRNAFRFLLDVLKPIKEALDEVFEPLSPDKLYELTDNFRKFTEEMKVSEDAASTLKTTFKLAFGGIKTILVGVKTAISGVTKLVKPMMNLFDAVFGLIGKIVSKLTGSKGVLDTAEKLGKIGDKISDKYLKTMQKLADWINKVADAIRNLPESPVFEKIHDGVVKGIDALKEFWQEFKELPVIQEMVSDFWDAVSKIEQAVRPVFDSVGQGIDNLKTTVQSKLNLQTLNDVLTKAYDKVKKFMQLIKDFAKRIKDFFQGIKDGKGVIESFKDNFGDVIDKVTELKDNLFDFFDKLFEKADEMGEKFNLAEIQQSIHDFVTNITPEQVTMIAIAGTFALIALNMLRLSNAVKDAIDSFTGIGKALKKVIDSYVKKQKSTVMQIAESIVIVAAAIWVLSKIPQADMEKAIGALITIAACLTTLTVVLTLAGIANNKWGGGKSLVELAAGLAVLAGSFTIIAVTMKMLEMVNLDGILPKLVTVGVILAALAGLSALMSKLNTFSKGSLTMLAISGALLVTSTALMELGNIPQDKLEKAMDAMFKLMIGLAAITIASGKVGVFSAVGLLTVVFTLDKLLPLIEGIVNYDYTKIKQGLEKNKDMLTMLGGIVLVMAAVGAIAGNRLKGAATAILSLAGTFAVMLVIAKLAGMMKPQELAKGEQFLWSMAGIIAVLELCSKNARIGMFGGRNGGEGSKMFTRIAVAMGILLGIAKLASMMEVKDIVKGELAVLGLTGIVLAMAAVARVAKDPDGIIKSVAGVIFAVSMILAEVALLSMIPMENMAPALTAILGIILALAALAAAISLNIKVYDQNTQQAAGSLWALATIMAIVAAMGVIMVQLAKQPIKGVASAAGALISVIGAVSLFAYAMSKFNGAGFSAGMLEGFLFSALMVAGIGAVLWFITDYLKKYNLDPNVMLKAAGSIAIVLLGLTPALLAMSTFYGVQYDYKAMATAVILAIAALASVAAAIFVLSNWGGDGQKMIDSAIAIGIGLIAMFVPIALLGVIGSKVQQVNIASMATIVIGAIGVLAGVATAIGVLSNLGNPDTMVQSAMALAIGLFAISVPIAVLGGVGALCQNISGSGIGAMAVAAIGAIVALGSVAYILYEFSHNMDIASLTILNNAVPTLALAIGGIAVIAVAIAAAGRIAGSWQSVVAGGLAMIEAIGVFALVVTAITGMGALFQKFTALEGFLEKGLDMVVLIAGKLGEAAGALIGGFGVGISDALGPIGDNMITFAEKMTTFSEKIKGVDSEAVEACKNLAAAMLYMGAAEVIEALLSIFGMGRIDNWNFDKIGAALAGFCKEIEDVSEDSITKAQRCSIIAKRLAEVAATLQPEGGVVQWLFGTKDLGKFAENIEAMGTAVKSFSDEVQDLPDNAVEMSQKAADASAPMIELSKTILADGGLLQDIIGHKDLGEFGGNLTVFATGLKSFIEKLVEIESIEPTYPELVRRCADATTPMVDLARGIQNSGGILAEWLGDNTLNVFGQTLIPFGNDLRIFVARIAAMAKENPNYIQLISGSVLATEQLVELSNKLENMGGIGSIFTGDNTLDKFGETLIGFGESLGAYATTLSGISLETIDDANASTEKLIVLGKFASGVGADAFHGLQLALLDMAALPISTLATEITDGTPQVITAVETLFTSLAGVANTRTTTDKTNYENYGKGIADGIKNGLDINTYLITNQITTLVNSIKTKLNNEMALTVWNVYGKNIPGGIDTGIRTASYLVTNALTAMVNGVKSKLNVEMAKKVWEVYGKNIPTGIAQGINDNKKSVTDAIDSMITAIKNKLSSAMTQSNFKTYGEAVPKGVADGINTNMSSINTAVDGLVSAIKDKLSSAMAESEFEEYGENVSRGLAKGINNKADKAVKAAEKMAEAVNKVLPSTLKEQSPSKLSYKYGMYYSIGLANGISDYSDDAVASTTDMADDIISSANTIIGALVEAMDSEIDTNPTIRPVLDLSDVTSKAQTISKLFDESDLAMAYNISGTVKQRAEDKANEAVKVEVVEDESKAVTKQPQQITFTQNNYSPKALNRYEIYRDTKNQIRQLKGALA